MLCIEIGLVLSTSPNRLLFFEKSIILSTGIFFGILLDGCSILIIAVAIGSCNNSSFSKDGLIRSAPYDVLCRNF